MTLLAPSASPTEFPSIFPTEFPSSQPSILPIVPGVLITFDASFFIHNVTSQQLDAASQKAVVATVAKTLDFSDWQGTERRRLASGRQQVMFVSQRLVASNTATSHQIEAVVNIEASTSDFADTQDDESGAVLYSKLVQKSDVALTSQSFTETLRVMSSQFNADSIAFAYYSSIAFGTFSIVQTTHNADENDLTGGQFAGVVIGVLFAFILCAVVIYLALSFLSTKDNTMKSSDIQLTAVVAGVKTTNVGSSTVMIRQGVDNNNMMEV